MMTATAANPKDDLTAGTPFAACAAEVRSLLSALHRLEDHAGLLQLAPLAGREWFETLTRKLAPQLGDDPFLVAAVVGGTNIGKSVVFNHLAGFRASAVSPLASGTKHPVCLVPPGFTERHDLAEIFQGFHLTGWTTSDAALEHHDEDQLFWQTSDRVPANLLALDTPDIDSDAQVNWARADHIRHCADVLIAILTQQKYNDAAVKQFFRKAAAEDKAVIIVFNQCLLPEDDAYWPLWLGTFTRETGIAPERVYVAPNDRRAAEENRLPFYPRRWPLSAPDAKATVESQPRSLRDDLVQLHFGEIKLRSLRGSLRQVLDPATGAPAYLQELRSRSSEFGTAAELLTSRQLARIQNWPQLPSQLLVREIRGWWRQQREGWTRTVHDAYNVVGETVLWPLRWARQQISGPDPDPVETYRRRELDVILLALENLYESLTSLSQIGNDLLRPRLARLLEGNQRVHLIERISEAHAAETLEEQVRQVVAEQMLLFRQDSPQMYDFLRQLDSVAAAARPMTSAVLFIAGGIPVAGSVVAPMLTEVVLHVAGGTGAVVVGEAALTQTASGLRLLEAKFRQLETAFVTRRLSWFAQLLKEQLLGNLQEELQTAANFGESTEFLSVQRSLAQLERLVRSETAAS